jgi:filamentous hemagglutinin family protein
MNRDVSVSPASFVSIVIVNYNQGRFLSSAIQSILRQTDTEFHLLIWDDGSSDHSVEIAQAFAAQDPRIKVVSAPHQGLGTARLQAITQTLAQTKETSFGDGDADDVLVPTALSVDDETGVFVLLPKLSYVRRLVAQIGAIAAAIPLTIALSLGSLFPLSHTAEAQSITPAADGINTQVDQQNNQYDITGGTQAGQNLFHSFYDFGLNTGETANFINPSTDISNILGRVTSGNPSVINGLIQISGGGSPNLFLMNPAGMVFGSGASLNLPGSFTATTATGIGLTGGGTFNALDGNNFNLLYLFTDKGVGDSKRPF